MEPVSGDFHDTFTRSGRKSFPEIPYWVPENFPLAEEASGTLSEETLRPFAPEVESLRIEGMPKVNEQVFFHRPSKTLIVCDLLFNLGPDVSWWRS